VFRFLLISLFCLASLYVFASHAQASVTDGAGDVAVTSLSVACSQTPQMRKAAVFQTPSPMPEADEIVVDKSGRLLHLLKDGVILRSYRTSLGGQPVGAKHQEGDGKTPEGLYWIDQKNSASDYTLSLHISYPNQNDINWARNHGVSAGGDIMIHGLPNAWWKRMFIKDGMDWTKGCVAVNHDDQITEIFRDVQVGTPVVLCP
jgi:murein L,D-transpeptidase YafK